MKKAVWKNRSNGQLCITVPKSSDIQEGDIVEIKKSSVKRISYVGVVADLFHYGHLSSIKFSNSVSDYNVCGVFTDEAVESYRIKPISILDERKKVIESLNCVDRVMVQNSRDPTENLKRLHQEFPKAEIILVHGDDWKDVPGGDYVKSIGGKVIKHPYYSRLSTFKIINYIVENKDKYKDITNFSSLINEKNDLQEEGPINIADKTIISTKADTLKALKPLLKNSKIEDIFSFTTTDWKNKKEEVLKNIIGYFSGKKIVIRSSAMNEDTLDTSMAGCFESFLNIDSSKIYDIENAIENVLDSYSSKNSNSSFNQVLVQTQTKDIIMSGVVFTRTLEMNAPYYVINYDDETGSTDSVTSGKDSKVINISHFSEDCPDNMKKLIESIKEIETKIPSIPLDIEFAINKNNEVIIFQVRPLAANLNKEKNDKIVSKKIDSLKKKFLFLSEKKNHLKGDETIFADMPDWNPAEIIGNNPNYLDFSLYDYIITYDAWHKARTSQGYYNVSPAKLVELFGNKPYVNVRNTFNSFTPASLSHELRDKLVRFYLNKLKKNPQLQDKVEFEILYTCLDFNFDKRSEELLQEGFNILEVKELKNSLLYLTNSIIFNGVKSINSDLNDVFSMEENRNKILNEVVQEKWSNKELIKKAKNLLDECREKGTTQFSRLARQGFVSKIILKSLVDNKFVDYQFYEDLFNSVSTVATEISEDFNSLTKKVITNEDFLKKYGHLRPGTYNIMSSRYDLNPSLLYSSNLDSEKKEKKEFKLNLEDKQKIDIKFKEIGFSFNAEEFITFVKSATEARELSKFEFTKNLSEVLELISKVGENLGFTKKELALLDIKEIFRSLEYNDVNLVTDYWKKIILERDEERAVHNKLVLPSIILSINDFEIIEEYMAKPNFITRKDVQAELVNIDEFVDIEKQNLENKVVLLENGDPGYDWIFTRNISGLITRYGGVASHMSIRCAEFGIPAAIGCGSLIYDKIKGSKSIIIDCMNSKIIPIK